MADVNPEVFPDQRDAYFPEKLSELYTDEWSSDWRGRLYSVKPGDKSEKKRLAEKKTDRAFLANRKEMAVKLRGICEWLQIASKNGAGDFIQTLRSIVQDACLENKHLDNLFRHLDETEKATRAFLEQLPDTVISARQKELLVEVVAPLHDLFKALGDTNQIDPDHENILEYILTTYATGWTVKGKKLTPEDVRFCAIVASNHEDIYRMRWFSTLLNSFDEPPETDAVDDPVGIDRAISLFHAIDLFGTVATIKDNIFRIDFDDPRYVGRFVDLFRRHIYLDIDGWRDGKAFLPEWGVYALHHIQVLSEKLEKTGIVTESGMIERLQRDLLSVLDEAIKAVNSAQMNDNGATLQKLQDARALLKKGEVDMGKEYGVDTNPFDLLSPEEATNKLKLEAEEIAENPDFGERSAAAIDLVTAMDTADLSKVLRDLGLPVDKGEIENFIRSGCADAMSLFRPKMTAAESVKARDGVNQPNVTQRLLKYWGKDPEDRRSREWLQDEITAIGKNRRTYLGAVVDFFNGDTEELIQLKNEKPERVEFLLIVLFGAHARWAVGQIERSRNEKSKDPPLERPIFGSLRRVSDAKREEKKASNTARGNPTKVIGPQKVRNSAVSSLGQDWDTATDRMRVELKMEGKWVRVLRFLERIRRT